jgi:divinyl protochlorophyllide a 8-vinyl-reductase
MEDRSVSMHDRFDALVPRCHPHAGFFVTAAPAGTGAMHPAGRIGPNAVNRVAEVLRACLGGAGTQHLFERAGLGPMLAEPPEEMVDEADVARLHHELRESLGHGMALRVARAAGTRTADYLLAHRIPRPVQWLLKLLPPAAAAAVLLSAIRRHAWTFAGSGRFEAQAGWPVRLSIHDNPLCRGEHTEGPACGYFAATFERLFRVLVSPHAEVVETACEACGDDACRFEIRW